MNRTGNEYNVGGFMNDSTDYSGYGSYSGRGQSYSASYGGGDPSQAGIAATGRENELGFMAEQLRLRETQLATASSLLQQQSQLISQVGMMGGGRSSYPYSGMDGSGPPPRFRSEKRSGGSYRDDDYSKKRRRDSGDRSPYGRNQGDRRRNSGNWAQRSPRHGRRNSGNRPEGGQNQWSESGRSRQRSRDGTSGSSKNSSKDKSTTYCHVCNFECISEEGLVRHRRNASHNKQARDMKDLPLETRLLVTAKMKMQEQLRLKKSDTKKSHAQYCMICDRFLDGTLEEHSAFKKHKFREEEVSKGCDLCHVANFRTYTDLLRHRTTYGHIRNYIKTKDKKESDCKKEGETKEGDDDDSTDIDSLPVFIEGVPMGQNYIISVTGYYCKLCNKFYKKEETAKLDHCQSESHFDKWKQAQVQLMEQARHQKAKEARKKKEAEKKEEDMETKEKNDEEEEKPKETVEAMDTDPSAEIEDSKPAEDSEPAAPAEPAEDSEPAAPAEPAEDSEPAAPAEPAEDLELAEPAEDSKPAESAEDSKQAEDGTGEVQTEGEEDGKQSDMVEKNGTDLEPAQT